MPSDTLSRVLCVDDDKDACEMLSALLSSCRIEVTCVQSAAEAWLKIKTRRFDLYMLDGWLPGVDGFEFCRQLREFDSDTPILFYSGAAYEADRKRGIAAGANAYVAKPDVDGLLETIADLVGKAKARKVAARLIVTQRRPAEKALSARFFSLETVHD